MTALEHLTEQLWAPALRSGARLRVGRTTDPAWRAVERYRMVPDVRRARLLIPAGSRQATRGALQNYRRLRRREENRTRTALAVAGRAGAWAALPQVLLEVPLDGGPSPDVLPLPALANVLGFERLHASIGVRTGANRKAILQLVDDHGRPVGYAKFGWDDVTSQFVATERDVLLALEGGGSGMRVPRALATFSFHGRPVLVTEPLPPTVTGCHRLTGMPSAVELHALCPVHRHGTMSSSLHLARLRGRLKSLAAMSDPEALGARASGLAERVAGVEDLVPITSRWHGDLSSWNCARDEHGGLWAWDWESSEPDVVAGLDPLHWAFSDLRVAGFGSYARPLTSALAVAGPHLVAAGLARRLHPLVAATYALTVVERAASLAERDGGWGRVWTGPSALMELLDEARGLVDQPA